MRIERLSRDEFDLLCARIAIGEPVSMGELLGARRYASEARERGQLLASLTVGYLAVTRDDQMAEGGRSMSGRYGEAGTQLADVGIGPYGEDGDRHG